MCPKCGRHGCTKLDSGRGDTFFRKYRCRHCGAVSSFCDLKWNTPEERAESLERKRAYKRQWYRDNRERALEVEKRRRDENRDAINRKARVKWRTDPEFRARRLAASAEYQTAHRDQRNEASRRYYETHRYECALRCKLSRLRRYRREEAEREACKGLDDQGRAGRGDRERAD